MPCQLPAAPDHAEAHIRDHLADGPFDLAMIGPGTHANIPSTLLFDRTVNVRTEAPPQHPLLLQHHPRNTLAALRS